MARPFKDTQGGARKHVVVARLSDLDVGRLEIIRSKLPRSNRQVPPSKADVIAYALKIADRELMYGRGE